MVFNSLHFAAFFVIAIGIYFLIPRRPTTLEKVLLLAAGYWFFGAWGWQVAGLITLSILLNYACGLLLDRTSGAEHTAAGWRSLILAVVAAVNLGILGAFWHCDFFLAGALAALGRHGLASGPGAREALQIVLPAIVAIYTWLVVNYGVNLYRKKVPVEKNLLTFAASAAFFPRLALIHRRLTARNAFLLAASYYFYGAWDWRFLGLIIVSTVLDYTCGRLLERSARMQRQGAGDGKLQRRRKYILAASLVGNLGILGFFKYCDFFVGSAVETLTSLGLPLRYDTLNIILPVGISFYTFQTLSYTIDLYRKMIPVEKNLLTFGVYVAFFPQLVAGPIERAGRLLPQVASVRRVTPGKFYDGCYLILWGLFKKILIADNLAHIVDAAFDGPAPGGGAALVALYAFAFQIYCDFSAYSDIARGCAKCMGFELMVNFRLPYFATSPRDFWSRWHISLSTWLRDYLYIPLGGNRKGPLRTNVNLMLTMVLGGIWHGAAWTFVIWGVYQGLLLIAHRAMEPFLKRHFTFRRPLARGLWFVARVALVFHLTCLGWLIFRATSLAQIGEFLSTMVSSFSLRGTGIKGLAAFTFILIVMQVFQYVRKDLQIVRRLPVYARGGFYAALFLICMLYGEFEGAEFIYFQF